MLSTRTLLRYWKPIAVFWVLLLATFWLGYRLQPRWKLQVTVLADKFPLALWTNERGEAYYTFMFNANSEWTHLTINNRRKFIVEDWKSPPGQSIKTEQKEDLSWLPDKPDENPFSDLIPDKQ